MYLATGHVLRGLMHRSLTLNTVVSVFLVLAKFLVVDRAGSIVFSTRRRQTDNRGRDQSVAAAVSGKSRYHLVEGPVLLRMFPGLKGLVFNENSM